MVEVMAFAIAAGIGAGFGVGFGGIAAGILVVAVAGWAAERGWFE